MQVKWKNLVEQNKVKDLFNRILKKQHLGHAYLFCGESGVGKFQAALEISMALLCEADADHDYPCYSCPSCKLFDSYSHPNFHLLFPILLNNEHKSSSDSSSLNEGGWQYISEETINRIKHPYKRRDSKLSVIPVEWIREINHIILRGPISGKTNIILIDDIDSLKRSSANAMLKTLEEPPAGTLIFLLTQRLYAVLPTIKSRAQVVHFSKITQDALVKVLENRYGEKYNSSQIQEIASASSGSLGKAIELLDQEYQAIISYAVELWTYCFDNQKWDKISRLLEKISHELCNNGKDYGVCEDLILAMMRHIRSSYIKDLNMYEPVDQAQPRGDKQCMDIKLVTMIYNCGEEAISALRNRSNILLVLVVFAFSLLEILHGKK